MLLHALAGRPGSPVFFAALSLLPVSSCVQFSEPLMKISFVYPFRGEPTPKTDSPIILICKSGDVDSIALFTYFVNMFNINFYTFFICFVIIPILPHKKRRKAKAYSHPCSVSKIYKSKQEFYDDLNKLKKEYAKELLPYKGRLNNIQILKEYLNI